MTGGILIACRAQLSRRAADTAAAAAKCMCPVFPTHRYMTSLSGEDGTTKYESFDVTLRGKVAHIQLNRPKELNSMIKSFWNDLPVVVDTIDKQSLARVIVVSSTGKHFSAGMDLEFFSSDDGGLTRNAQDNFVYSEQLRHHIKIIQSTFNTLEDCRLPVLVACQGGIIGGAVDLITAGDIRYCTKDAFFCIQETNIGMTADLGTFPRLQRYVPEGWVKQLAYTGERLGAVKAKEIGLVNEIYETHEHLLEGVLTIADKIASKNPLAVTGCKTLINYGRDHSTKDTLDYTALWNAAMFAPTHLLEATAATKEKREAHFPDLLPVRKTPM